MKQYIMYCAKGDHTVDEMAPNCETPTLLDRKCGIVWEWSVLSGRWYEYDLRDYKNVIP